MKVHGTTDRVDQGGRPRRDAPAAHRQREPGATAGWVVLYADAENPGTSAMAVGELVDGRTESQHLFAGQHDA
jgi:hypothetical protein